MAIPAFTIVGHREPMEIAATNPKNATPSQAAQKMTFPAKYPAGLISPPVDDPRNIVLRMMKATGMMVMSIPKLTHTKTCCGWSA